MYLGVDSRTGKQRYLTRTVHGTKREAEAVCAELVAAASRGEHGDTTAGTLEDLVDRWLEHVTPNISPSTRAGYDVYLRKHILPALGTKRIDRLRPADIDRFYASLRGSLAPASVRKVHNILRSALGQAVKWRMLSSNPAASATPPRIEKRPIEPPTPAEVTRLLAAATEADPELGLYVRLAAVTGARRGELCAIRWTDLDLDAAQLVIARAIVVGPEGIVVKTTKTNRVRRVALDAGTIAALRSQREVQLDRAASCRTVLAGGAYVFARDPKGREPWRPDSSATGRFMALRDRLGLHHVRLYDLRHYVATRLLDAGVPVRSVSERLGHASATTTLTIYAAAVPATDRRSADILGDLLGGAGGMHR